VKILLLGNTGQLGWELNRTLLTLGEITALDFPQLNMADPENIRTIVRESRPNLIVNATAYTNVDKAESEIDLALAINGSGPGVLAQEAKNIGAALIHYSTDFVFDGKKGTPYTEQDQPNPIDAYGRTKLAGETAIQEVGSNYLIFRTSWVYSTRRPCFVTKVLEWAKTRTELRVVDDQVSTPTWARTLAEASAQVIAQGKSDPLAYLKENRGLYHLTDGGFCSRFEWAREIIRLAGLSERVTVQPAKSIEFPTPAVRPEFSALECAYFEQSFDLLLPNWREVLPIVMG